MVTTHTLLDWVTDTRGGYTLLDWVTDTHGGHILDWVTDRRGGHTHPAGLGYIQHDLMLTWLTFKTIPCWTGSLSQ